jgi:uncharacterized protein YggE
MQARREIMKMNLVTILVAVFSISTMNGAAAAQDRPTVTAQPNSIYVGADGKFDATPDTAVVQFNISAQEDTARDAYDRASKAAEQIRGILRSNGIEPKTAEIGFFAVQPVYDYKTAKRKLVAYRVDSSVSVKIKDFSKVASITQQLADMDVTQNQTLNYTLDDVDAAKAKAVDDAYRRARDSANVIAQSSGRTLGELSYASVDTFENVRVQPMLMAAPMAAEVATSG